MTTVSAFKYAYKMQINNMTMVVSLDDINKVNPNFTNAQFYRYTISMVIINLLLPSSERLLHFPFTKYIGNAKIIPHLDGI